MIASRLFGSLKSYFTFILIFLLAGCSKTPPAESVTRDVHATDSVIHQTLAPDPDDSLSYIGYVNRSVGTDQFFTELSFSDKTHADQAAIVASGGKEVFRDEELTKTRFELDQVGHYFNLSGLRTIAIYNRRNEKLTTGRLSHIEYVEDPIESKFVAVFQVDNAKIGGPVFCVGNSDTDLKPLQFVPFVDLKLNQELIRFLRLDPEHVENVKHYKLNGAVSYSTISADTTAYIVDTTGKFGLLYKSAFNEMIIDLDAISGMVNGRIILLTLGGQPDTDFLWSSLLVFDGKEYRVKQGDRIKKTEYTLP